MATIETLMRRTVKVGNCLEFTGHICKTGYGLVWHDGKNRSAHRVSFELHNAPIVDGQHDQATTTARFSPTSYGRAVTASNPI